MDSPQLIGMAWPVVISVVTACIAYLSATRQSKRQLSVNIRKEAYLAFWQAEVAFRPVNDTVLGSYVLLDLGALGEAERRELRWSTTGRQGCLSSLDQRVQEVYDTDECQSFRAAVMTVELVGTAEVVQIVQRLDRVQQGIETYNTALAELRVAMRKTLGLGLPVDDNPTMLR